MAVRRSQWSAPPVCKFWAMGICKKNPCRFFHPDLNQTQKKKKTLPLIHNSKENPKSQPDSTRPDLNHAEKKNLPLIHNNEKTPKIDDSTQKPKIDAVCKFWADGRCIRGVNRCPLQHAWFRGDDSFSAVAKLQGHQKGISGIVLPKGTSKLVSSAKDGTVRMWDCNSGQCIKVVNLGAEAGCLYNEGPWILCAVSNFVKAWNLESETDFTLNGPVGKIHAMEAGIEMLLAGTEEGLIYVWKGEPSPDPKANPFHPAAILSGHTGAVLSLKVGSTTKLYSGSADHTIRVWDLETLECTMILNGHSDAVTSLVCWSAFLISCSLDQTIKVWGLIAENKIDVIYTHNEERGLVALCGVRAGEDISVLACSSADNSVHLYDLPSFSERGRLFARRQVKTIQVGPGGLFFTGDETGLISVWNWFDPGFQPEQEVNQESS